MTNLYDTPFFGNKAVVQDLLYPGTYLLAGAPKIGKSFLVTQIAYHVSIGAPLWERTVNQGSTLYLALEDTQSRMQERLFRMFDSGSCDNLHFTFNVKSLQDGLIQQLDHFVKHHPDTRLIIIDTLQKIRGSFGQSYGGDYELIGALKRFADKAGICLIIVHHLRKQGARDEFERISGTSGLLGAVDGAILFQKDSRTSNNATMEVTGRDQQEQLLFLIKNPDHLTWTLDHTETELWKAPPDPVLEKVNSLLTEDRPCWEGRVSDLANALEIDLKPNALSRKLNMQTRRLKDEYKIEYRANVHTRNGSLIRLCRIPDAS